MFLFYYDEVKYDPPTQESFWLGGVGVRSEHLAQIENSVNDLSLQAFGRRTLVPETEFHGKDLFHGKGAFKGRDVKFRFEVFRQLLEIIAALEVIKFCVRIIPANFVHSQEPDEVAFMFMIEQLNQFLTHQADLGMLFGDFDEPSVGPSVVSLSSYREGGTLWSRRLKIDRIIDTVHFAKSHHSRLIQLADVFLYSRQMYRSDYKNHWKKVFADEAMRSGALNCQITRTWPVERHWYRGL